MNIVTLVRQFRPSNSDEGMAFEEKWCENCKHYDQCNILANAFACDNFEYWHYAIFDNGECHATCTEFKPKDDTTPRGEESNDPNQLNLFK